MRGLLPTSVTSFQTHLPGFGRYDAVLSAGYRGVPVHSDHGVDARDEGARDRAAAIRAARSALAWSGAVTA